MDSGNRHRDKYLLILVDSRPSIGQTLTPDCRVSSRQLIRLRLNPAAAGHCALHSLRPLFIQIQRQKGNAGLSACRDKEIFRPFLRRLPHNQSAVPVDPLERRYFLPGHISPDRSRPLADYRFWNLRRSCLPALSAGFFRFHQVRLRSFCRCRLLFFYRTFQIRRQTGCYFFHCAVSELYRHRSGQAALFPVRQQFETYTCVNLFCLQAVFPEQVFPLFCQWFQTQLQLVRLWKRRRGT